MNNNILARNLPKDTYLNIMSQYGPMYKAHEYPAKEQLCTGCGICEYKCPVEGEAAIRVVAVKEMMAAK